MIYAGIDVAKLNHFASVISSDGEVLVEPFKFSNDFEGFRSLSLVLDKYDREQLLVDLESTAHYGNNLVEFLVAKGYRFCVLNPIEQIELLDRQINDAEAKIEEIVKAMGSVIMTIPGIRYVEAGMILGEIGDIHRFPDYHNTT